MTLGGVVKEVKTVFVRDLWPKKTYTFFAPMMIWYYDTMTL